MYLLSNLPIFHRQENSFSLREINRDSFQPKFPSFAFSLVSFSFCFFCKKINHTTLRIETA